VIHPINFNRGRNAQTASTIYPLYVHKELKLASMVDDHAPGARCEMAEKDSRACKRVPRCHNDLIDLLLTSGTDRRGAYELVVRGGQIIAQDGLRSFAERSQRYLRRKLFPSTNPPAPPSQRELEDMRLQSAGFEYRPKISIITPVYNTPEDWLRGAIDSVLQQAYDNWELCIVDDGSGQPHIREILDHYQREDGRIKVKYLNENKGISNASNEALALASGEFVGFLDHDDQLPAHALYEVVRLLNWNANADFIYSDEIMISEREKPIYALFRPDFSLDYLLSHCYIIHFAVIRKSILKEIGGFRTDFAVSQDYDLFLRVVSQTRNISHIPKILYKWRQHQASGGHQLKERVMESSRRALQDFADREGIGGEVYCTKHFNFFRLKRDILDQPKISIIIPTRDRIDLLSRCIESIQAKSSYGNYEVIVVDNLSQEEESAAYFDSLQRSHNDYKILKFNETFNYSRLNNYAAKFALGDHLLFLNNDVEVLNPDWLEAMLEQSQRDEIGCVGAKLLYPDKKIQHVGVIVGGGGRAEHIYKWSDSNYIGYMGHFVSIRNYSAVTAACLMIRRSIFDEVGGFDEGYEVGFGDVDLCLRVRELGYENLFTPYAELIHHESATRGKSISIDPHPSDTKRFMEKWKKYIDEGDPYYNPNLPLDCFDILPYVSW
jgi:GT2 family glycosyltransferase